MPTSTSVLLFFAVAFPGAQASRLKVVVGDQAGGPHKCTISWPGRRISAPATASFGVANCRIGCKITMSDVRPERVFPAGFQAVTAKKSCSCQTQEGRELFKIPGACGEVNAAKAKCFDIYKRITTDEYKSEFNKETLKVFHNDQLWKDHTFEYPCKENGCEGNECTEYYLPSVWDTRGPKEKNLLADLIKKAATGGSRDLSVQQRDLLRTLAKEDISNAAELAKGDVSADIADQIQALFLRAEADEDVLETPKSVTPKDDKIAQIFEELTARFAEEDNGFTVAKLKEHYKWLLQDTGVSVDHLATVAGLTDDGKVVTEEDLAAFLEPAC